MPIVVKLGYIRILENSLRSLSYILQEANFSSLNKEISKELDLSVSHIKNILKGLTKITTNPLKFTVTSSA